MRGRRRLRPWLLAAAAVACGQGGLAGEEAGAAREAVDSVELLSDEASALELALQAADAVAKRAAGATAEQLAAAAAARVAATLQPPSCLAETVDGATVTYSLSDCSGPRGIVHLTGTLAVVYSVDASGIHAHATATDLAVYESTLDLDATGTYATAGGDHTLSVSSHSSGTGSLGQTVAHQGSYSVSWTDMCHTLNGSFSTLASGLSRTTTVSALTRCGDFCPRAGGTVTHTFRNGRTLTLTFQGATATWSSGERSGTIQLACTPEPA